MRDAARAAAPPPACFREGEWRVCVLWRQVCWTGAPAHLCPWAALPAVCPRGAGRGVPGAGGAKGNGLGTPGGIGPTA